MDSCVHCWHSKSLSFKQSCEVYFLIKTLIYPKLGRDIFHIIVDLAYHNITKLPKPRNLMNTRCLECNRKCHVAYCNRNIIRNGIDVCSKHGMRMYLTVAQKNK